ncbi:NAD(P)H dehydrogenase (quinone) [Reichenbachiella agariperforans]|uniref:NAD(P)H dehydrogenase (Quinone) n=1 Tax=Reichenbachiella agariperforans TaxID=156994 RepID=A0A1M6N4A0_REIAG|nr:SDR family oxidoreductase [Reichenbachiella agariperforans]SHJ90529.1 NAD(P)H dehydrogenase (quinone) [Reichenbachiella agariperforans]
MQILVTGTTGNLGRSVIETLLKNIPAQNISAFVREEEKILELKAKGINVFRGDYDNVSTLESAMANVDTVLLISAGDQGNRLQQHRNIIDTAKKSGVKNIAYTSRAMKNRSTLAHQLMEEHFLTEDYIKASGLNYTIFRNTLYMDVLPLFVGKKVFETGIYQPAGDGKVAFALRKEMGEAMANVLSNEACENKTYKFTNNESYSFYDIAKALTTLSGKEVNYQPVDISAFQERMRPTGIPAAMLQKVIEFNTDIKNGQEDETTNDLENKLGRKPTTLKEGLKTLFGL